MATSSSLSPSTMARPVLEPRGENKCTATIGKRGLPERTASHARHSPVAPSPPRPQEHARLPCLHWCPRQSQGDSSDPAERQLSPHAQVIPRPTAAPALHPECRPPARIPTSARPCLPSSWRHAISVGLLRPGHPSLPHLRMLPKVRLGRSRPQAPRPLCGTPGAPHCTSVYHQLGCKLPAAGLCFAP